MTISSAIAASLLLAAQPAAQPAPAEPPAPAEAAAPRAATAEDLVAGAPVRGVDGSVIGAIEDADDAGATVVSGAARLRLPLNNFQKDGDGLRIGATRAQFLAAAGATATDQPS